MGVIRLQASKGQPSHAHISHMCTILLRAQCLAEQCGVLVAGSKHTAPSKSCRQLCRPTSHTCTPSGAKPHAGGRRGGQVHARLMPALVRRASKHCSRDGRPASIFEELATRKRSACLRPTGSSWAPPRTPASASPSGCQGATHRQPGRCLPPQTTCAVSITRSSHLEVLVERAGWDCPRVHDGSLQPSCKVTAARRGS